MLFHFLISLSEWNIGSCQGTETCHWVIPWPSVYQWCCPYGYAGYPFTSQLQMFHIAVHTIDVDTEKFNFSLLGKLIVLIFFLTHLHVIKHTLKTNRVFFCMYVCMLKYVNGHLCISAEARGGDGVPWPITFSLTPLRRCISLNLGMDLWPESCRCLPAPTTSRRLGLHVPMTMPSLCLWLLEIRTAFLMLVQQVHLLAQPSPKPWSVSF